MRGAKVRMRRSATFLFIATFFVVGCGQDTSSAEDAVVKSTDGQFQVTIPSGWSAQSALNDAADIQVANPRTESYVIVLSEPKADFENPTIEWHSELTRTMMLKSLTGGQITAGPKEFQINGQPALQYEIRGTVGSIKVVYLHTTVDTGQHLHQILAWTLPSHYDDNRAEMESVINSFKATPK
jgi:hypothetical protein